MTPPASGSTEEDLRAKATVVLVHGAFADSSSWDGVTPQLQAQGHRVVAANPLRSVKADAGQIAALLNSISGPIVLVGHSYGGMVISPLQNSDAAARRTSSSSVSMSRRVVR